MCCKAIFKAQGFVTPRQSLFVELCIGKRESVLNVAHVRFSDPSLVQGDVCLQDDTTLAQRDGTKLQKEHGTFDHAADEKFRPLHK